MKECDFGCGQYAIHQFKSSQKWCCSKNTSSCPSQKEKQSKNKKGKNPFEGKEHPKGFSGKQPFNKGKTYEDIFGFNRAEDIKSKISESTKGRNNKLQFENLSLSKKNEIRNNLKENRIGGYIRGSGRGKKGWYKGFWCDSSWELAYVIYCIDHSIPIERNAQKFKYTYDNKEYNFIPDFVVENRLVEIKGVWSEKEHAKIEQCGVEIEIIDKDGIGKYIKYVCHAYGNNFIQMYENEDKLV